VEVEKPAKGFLRVEFGVSPFYFSLIRTMDQYLGYSAVLLPRSRVFIVPYLSHQNRDHSGKKLGKVNFKTKSW